MNASKLSSLDFFFRSFSKRRVSWRLSVMKFSRDISRVNWLNGEKANVSKTISVLVLRVLIWTSQVYSIR
jgi:hypothetical protein